MAKTPTTSTRDEKTLAAIDMMIAAAERARVQVASGNYNGARNNVRRASAYASATEHAIDESVGS